MCGLWDAGCCSNPCAAWKSPVRATVHVEGITVVNPQHYTILGGESRKVTVRNVKSFSSRGWSDGIDLMCCHDWLVDDVFLRTSDDCLAFYNHRWWFGEGRAT